jgi:hypothetical protein
MAARDLAEGMLPSETYVGLWYDDETHEICMQHGYVVLMIPVEDYPGFVGLLQQAGKKLKEAKFSEVSHGRKG